MQTDLPSRIGRLRDLKKNILFFLMAKMTPLKTKAKTKKNLNFLKNLMFVWEKNWKSILSYFQKFSSTWAKNDWFYMILAN